MTTRRNFLSGSLAAAVGTSWHARTTELVRLGLLPPPPRRGVRADAREPDLKALTKRALDAAVAAGASYADVRVTFTERRDFTNSKAPKNSRRIAIGVRALTQGAWGFASDSEVTADMAAWLGGTAARLGQVGAWPNGPRVDLGERLPAAVGTWQMPVKRDPMAVPDNEYLAYFEALRGAGRAAGASDVFYNFKMGRQERTFASTDGTFTTQTIYQTFKETEESPSGFALVKVVGGAPQMYPFPHLASPNGLGYEVFEEHKFIERIPELMKQVSEMDQARPFENPGRYEVVFDGYAMAALVSTLGAALEADRVLGYEANATGTSYLGPIAQMVGTTPFPPAVTLTANRSQVGGAANVKWDDEGVEPQDYPLVQAGKLVDYVTSREFVPELAAWYRAQGQPLRSHGSATAESALREPLVRTPNLRLHPDAHDTDFEALLSGIDNGYAIMAGNPNPDQQQLNLMGRGHMVYEVKKGRLGGVIDGARYLVRMPELWKNLVALGGTRSAVTRGFTPMKGQPEQYAAHSVQAPAARFRNVTLITLNR